MYVWCSECLGRSRVGRSPPWTQGGKLLHPLAWLFLKPNAVAHSVIRGGKETGGRGKSHWPWWGQWDGDRRTQAWWLVMGMPGLLCSQWHLSPQTTKFHEGPKFTEGSVYSFLWSNPLTPSHPQTARAEPILETPSFPGLNSVIATKKLCGPLFSLMFFTLIEEPAEWVSVPCLSLGTFRKHTVPGTQDMASGYFVEWVH